MIEPPLALLDHDPPGRAHAEEDARLHDGDRREPLLVGDVLRVRADVADARVVDDDVEPAEVRDARRANVASTWALCETSVGIGLRAHAERARARSRRSCPPPRRSPRRRCPRRRARAARRCHGRGPRRRPSRAPPFPRGSCPPKLHSTLQGRDRLSRLSSPLRTSARSGRIPLGMLHAGRPRVNMPRACHAARAGGLVQLHPTRADQGALSGDGRGRPDGEQAVHPARRQGQGHGSRPLHGRHDPHRHAARALRVRADDARAARPRRHRPGAGAARACSP